MSGIGAPLRLLRTLLPMNCGMGATLMSPTFEFVAALAYVHVYKDKRRPLESHMEKCVFLGYPDGYKGWKFYKSHFQVHSNL